MGMVEEIGELKWSPFLSSPERSIKLRNENPSPVGTGNDAKLGKPRIGFLKVEISSLPHLLPVNGTRREKLRVSHQ